MSTKIDYKIWESPPHLSGHLPGTRLVRPSRGHRRKGFLLNPKTKDSLPIPASS
jgi:hypothetical protein